MVEESVCAGQRGRVVFEEAGLSFVGWQMKVRESFDQEKVYLGEQKAMRPGKAVTR